MNISFEMKLILTSAIFYSLFIGNTFSQQLIINEISQGTGAKEYVEFLVMGTSTCQSPVPCLDLRGVVLDDNDGYFSTSASGSGIAAGAIRFANTTFWSCIPQGTIIVIYNENDVNTALPADDISLLDGNCRLILPSNSTLFEGQNISPNSSNPYVYPVSGWIAGGGSWNQVAMSNSNDSYQIRNNVAAIIPSFSISWGNNTVNSTIYFSSAGGSVFSLTNAFGLNPATQGNWTVGAVGTDETPGIGNNLANSIWIASMNPQCGTGAPSLEVNLAGMNVTCLGLCDGSITSTITNGAPPFIYQWSNGASTPNVATLCAGTYVLQITDQNGCTQSNSITISPGVSSGTASIQPAGPFNSTDATYSMMALPAGGVWSSNCGACLSSSGIFNPSIPGNGIYQICYTIGSGSCLNTVCTDVQVTVCPSEITVETISICPGTTVDVFGEQIGVSGVFSNLFQNSNGCDSTHEITVQLILTYPVNETFTICVGDSILIDANWVTNDYYSEVNIVDNNGCLVKNTLIIAAEKCDLEEFFIYIPNVFTPNNDGVNDLYAIQLEGGYLDEGFIVNRWGELIASFDNSNRTWDGTTPDGSTVVDGTYTYVLYYTPIGENQLKAQGFVTLIR
jgi:gliding motility-associated-like protein